MSLTVYCQSMSLFIVLEYSGRILYAQNNPCIVRLSYIPFAGIAQLLVFLHEKKVVVYF